MKQVAHQQQLKLAELPKWVMMTEEGTRFHVQIPQLGRVPLQHGDWIEYDADWNPVGVIRKSVMESML